MRGIEIELGGMKLPLRYEAINLYALKTHTGMMVIKWINELVPQPGETHSDVALRCADPSYVVPTIAAGLAHLDEYASMPYARLKTKICMLLDAESEKQGIPLVVAGAEVLGQIAPVLMESVLPPGKTIQDVVDEARAAEAKAKKEQEEAAKGALPLSDGARPKGKRAPRSQTGQNS